MAYRNTLDGFALNTLHKMPNIPDFHLMIGCAEDLTPLPLLIYDVATIPTELVTGMNYVHESSNADIQQAIADNVIELDDISFYMATLGMGVV